MQKARGGFKSRLSMLVVLMRQLRRDCPNKQSQAPAVAKPHA